MSKSIAMEAERPSPKPRGAASPLGLPFLLTLPTLLVVFVVFGIPLIYALALSLHRINMLTQQWMFVGLANYIDILPEREFIAAFARTAYFAVVTVLGGLILGMAMALVLNLSFPGRNFLRSIVLVPWAMAPVAVGVLWGWMFNGEYGTLNAILFDLGLIEKADPLARRWRRCLQPGGARSHLEPSTARHAPDPRRSPVLCRKICTAPRASMGQGRYAGSSASRFPGYGRCCC